MGKDIIMDAEEMAKLTKNLHDAACRFYNIKTEIKNIQTIMGEMYDGCAVHELEKAFEELYDHYNLIEESHYQLEQFVYDEAFGMGEVDVDRSMLIAPEEAAS